MLGSGAPLVAGYELVELLGRGGFASVYRARQVAFGRDVALKVLDGAATDEGTLRMFDRERRAAGSLSWHPHVVPIYDGGTTEAGIPYLSMELVPSGSLADRLEASGPLPAVDALRFGAEVAAALGAAHEAGLLHRDVKPANVLIDRLNRGRLADFGIARVVGSDSATASGAVVGTVAYMAPEVLHGAPATPASDIYALGITMYTLLLGRNPFSRSSDESPFTVITRVMAGQLPALPALPSGVGELIAACAASDPARRPSSAEEVAATLQRLGAGTAPLPDTRVPPAEKANQQAPTRPSEPENGREGSVGGPGAVPPPPESAFRVRPDHTLAVPPEAPPHHREPTTVTVEPGAEPDAGLRSGPDGPEVPPGSSGSAGQPAETSGGGRRGALIAAGGAALVAIIVGIFLVVGGGEGEAPDAGKSQTTASEGGTDSEPEGSSSSVTDSSESPDSEGSESSTRGEGTGSTPAGGLADTAASGSELERPEQRGVEITSRNVELADSPLHQAFLKPEDFDASWVIGSFGPAAESLADAKCPVLRNAEVEARYLAREVTSTSDDGIRQVVIRFTDEAGAAAYYATALEVCTNVEVRVTGGGDESFTRSVAGDVEHVIRVGRAITIIRGTGDRVGGAALADAVAGLQAVV